MTADEVQAMLNMMQKQEKQYRGYFGKRQQQPRGQEPDLFNMSPEEIMQYMQQRMNDPFSEPQSPGRKGDEKDW